ncbi:Flp pilus assembly protein TadD [Variovorax sp. W1I1]|uniref:hypothetical protein n=1 Tax=Variovorax sp. W1I1 TaxID=3042309 RepID=UPI002789FFC9|nr:hypothetical protein [Variovorax sp. W1I1]MDQ0612241.1 Flp pilus assembly protein TadD [Variovorax sp. W1I1]
MKAMLPTRRLIPKWRQVKRSLATNEAAASVSTTKTSGTSEKPRDGNTRTQPTPSLKIKVDLEEFEQAVALWKEFKEPGVLGDILSFSMYPSLQRRIIDIGTQALQIGAGVSTTQRFMIRHLANTNGRGDDLLLPEPGSNAKDQVRPFAQPIRRLRELLRTNPRNPLALLDFAQLQAAIGHNDTAERALQSALGLAPSNRLVLRTLARFYVHAGDPERAHLLLRRNARTPYDPWLISSEIALANLADTHSTFLTKGRRMLVEAGKSPSSNFSELAGSIAMVELEAGNLKKARELQRIALLDPTDNVAAQAVDRIRQFGIALNSPKIEHAISSSAEAQMLQAWLTSDPAAVENHALDWHNEEPFSSRPIQVLTALFAYKRDTQRALNWLSVGLRSDSEDRGLLLNLAFVQARAGHLEQARQTILKTRRLWRQDAEPYLLATEGVIAYQLQHFDEGDRLYSNAIALCEKLDGQQGNISTDCILNQAIIALELQHPRAAEIVARSNDAMTKKPSREALMLLKIVTSEANAPELPQPALQEESQRQRLTSQWVFNSKTNTLVERKGLTAPGAKAILLLEDLDRNK